MSQPADVWYVRLPEGRVLRAASTDALRHHLGAGRVPLDSRVRRSEEDEWTALEWTREFADLVPQLAHRQPADVAPTPSREPTGAGLAGVSSRLDPLALHTAGLAGLLEELVSALDAAIVRRKLVPAAIMGVLSALVMAFLINFGGYLPASQQPAAWAAAALLILIIGAVGNALLTQGTYVELSKMRPAKWAEARTGLGRYSVRLFMGYLLTVGGPLVIIGVLRWLPVWLAPTPQQVWLPDRGTMASDAVVVLGMVLELVLWPMITFGLLLGPMVVIEETSVFRSLAEWWRLLSGRFGQVFLYEMLTLGIGVVATLALVLPLVAAASGRIGAGDLDNPIMWTVFILGGLAAAPLIAYLAVANVFIYLNLRYESGAQR